MPSKHGLCQQCGSILKTEVCLKCGYNPLAPVEEFTNSEELNEGVNEKVEAPVEDPKLHHQVQSIFSEMAAASGGNDTAILAEEPSKRRYITPLILSLILFALAGGSYWRFIYLTPDYVSPLVLAASDIRDAEGLQIPENSDLEKTIDLDSKLESGNFEANNFAQFGAPDTKAFIQAFNLENAFDVYGSSDLFKELKTEYDISDDDFEVYFSKGFAYFVPGNKVDTWGLAIGVNNKSYIETRLSNFNKKKEDPKYKYAKYHVKLVEVGLPKESTESADEKDEDNDDNAKAQMYLLVSNSNEYLDQMKESSEGNLNNLAEDIVYAQSRADLPKLGEVFVYKDKDSKIWDVLSDIAGTKYSYVGLDKVLKALRSTGIAFYSVDSKLRMTLSKD